MTNSEYNSDKKVYNIKIDGVLFKQIEKYKQSKKYKTIKQAASELIQIGLDVLCGKTE